MCERCFWVNLKKPLYVQYHDQEWGRPEHNDQALYELLILECFQAGLSWECILNKRENFRKAYDNFDINKVIHYGDDKVDELLNNPGIIRNKLKIRASINNSIIFKKIQVKWGSFDKYIWSFTRGETTYETFDVAVSSPLSDNISEDLRKQGMTFLGTKVIYAYLQSIGVINAHAKNCFCRDRWRSKLKNS